MRSSILLALNLAALPAFALAPAKPIAPPPIVTPSAAKLTLSGDGRSILLDGRLEPGVAAKFEAAANAAPGLRTVVLQSKGGLLGEAIAIADVVRAKGLDTYVETWCHSACTVVLLAGRDRAASPRARIGFHQPIFPGAEAADVPTLRSVSRRFYDDAGVQPGFTDRAFATPASEMWFPESGELQSARVLTRISLGGETMAGASQIKSRDDIAASMNVVPFWPALKARFPEIADGVVDEAWRAKQAGRTDNEIISAGRAVLMKNYPKILATASDALLADYLDLVVEQAMAARALSFEACDKAFKGELNIAATLPPSLLDREFAILSKVLAAPAATAPRRPPPIEDLIGPIALRLPADQLEAVGATGADYSKPARCDGMIAMLREIQKLPLDQRSQLTQAMFLSE